MQSFEETAKAIRFLEGLQTNIRKNSESVNTDSKLDHKSNSFLAFLDDLIEHSKNFSKVKVLRYEDDKELNEIRTRN